MRERREREEKGRKMYRPSESLHYESGIHNHQIYFTNVSETFMYHIGDENYNWFQKCFTNISEIYDCKKYYKY